MIDLRPWAYWRRLQYGSLFTVFWILVIGSVYYLNFYQAPSCFDKQQNGNEGGIDCDGSCVRICSASVIPPVILWAESFEIIDGQYNALAYIENKNKEASTADLRYSFKLLDGEEVIAEVSGKTILPPDSVYPIFAGRIETKDDRKPTKTIIEIEPPEMWQPATVGRDQFRTLSFELLGSDTEPRLNVKIENTELTKAEGVEVVATIFNQAGKPVTASQTFIDDFDPRSSREIVFTWPNSIAKTVRSCEVPSDIMLVLDRSGSMAADGGEPPEPLESAKKAAASFVRLVRNTDQMGYVTYATTPSQPIEQTLTNNLALIDSAIQNTKMGEDGVQYTNMGDAFAVALTELTSSRHRDNARKVLVFLTDGDVTRPVNPQTGEPDRLYAANYALEMAKKAKDAEVTIYTIGFGDFFNSEGSEVARDIELIKSLASDPALYFEAPTVAKLQAVYQQIANDLCEEGPTKIEIITKTSTNFAPLR
jgi:Mg-chelatase subunit ChlD